MRPNSINLLDLQVYSGKVIYLDFWHSACRSCRQSLPALNRIRQRLGTDGLEIIGVNLDRQPRLALDFLSRYPVEFPVVSDVANMLVDQYALDVFPTGFVIDQAGLIRQIHRGFSAADVAAIEGQLKALMTSRQTGGWSAAAPNNNAVAYSNKLTFLTNASTGVVYAQR